MFVDHYTLAKKFNQEVYCFAKIKKEKQKKGGKKFNIFGNFISNFLVANEFFKTNDVQETQFLEDLRFLIVKNHLLLYFVQNV